jgi:hypothetical protein
MMMMMMMMMMMIITRWLCSGTAARCVSVHMRRGDKELENDGRPLVENLSDYFETAVLLRSMENERKV